jgi:hypothetical protein
MTPRHGCGRKGRISPDQSDGESAEEKMRVDWSFKANFKRALKKLFFTSRHYWRLLAAIIFARPGCSFRSRP